MPEPPDKRFANGDIPPWKKTRKPGRPATNKRKTWTYTGPKFIDSFPARLTWVSNYRELYITLVDLTPDGVKATSFIVIGNEVKKEREWPKGKDKFSDVDIHFGLDPTTGQPFNPPASDDPDDD